MSGREGDLLLLSVSSQVPHFRAAIASPDTLVLCSKRHEQLCCPQLTLTSHCSLVLVAAGCVPRELLAFPRAPGPGGHQASSTSLSDCRHSAAHLQRGVSGSIASAPRDIAVFVSLYWVLLVGVWPWGKTMTGTCLLAFVHPLGCVSCSLLSTALPWGDTSRAPEVSSLSGHILAKAPQGS